MLLWTVTSTYAEPYLAAKASTCLFVEGALKALEDASFTHKSVILGDIASQIDCDPEALSFLIHDETVDIETDIALPDFQARLNA